jgi:hypothetical protein
MSQRIEHVVKIGWKKLEEEKCARRVHHAGWHGHRKKMFVFTPEELMFARFSTLSVGAANEKRGPEEMDNGDDTENESALTDRNRGLLKDVVGRWNRLREYFYGNAEGEEAAESNGAASDGSPSSQPSASSEQREVRTRGEDPEDPESETSPRIVGRASELDSRQNELHYFLAFLPNRSNPGRGKFEWKRLDEMNSPEFREAFLLLPTERRGSDPSGNGWVVSVKDAEEGGKGREYLVKWFVWKEGRMAPVKVREEWRMYDDFVKPSLADTYDERAKAGVEKVDSGDDSGDESDRGGGASYDTRGDEAVDPTAREPSSIRWDPSLGRPRLSLRAAVQNHQPNDDWSLRALKSYVLMRRFVIFSRVPPMNGAKGAPSQLELNQLGNDLFFVNEPKLKKRWTTMRNEEKRARDKIARNNNNQDDDDVVDEAKVAQIEADAWRVESDVLRKTLVKEAQGRWRALWEIMKPELEELDAQLIALEIVDRGDFDALPELSQRVKALVSGRGLPNWPRAFARPRMRQCNVRNYLSESRSKEAERWLLLQREEHTNAPPNQYERGIMGSSLGTTWPNGSVPSSTQAPGEHTVPIDWYQPGCALIFENRDGRHCPVGIHIALQTQNVTKAAFPLGIFSREESRRSTQIYNADLPFKKQAQLAKSTAFAFLAYLGLSDKKNSKSLVALSKSCGVGVYEYAWQNNKGNFVRLIRAKATQWERRIQLLCLGMDWQVGNPLVLYPDAFDDNLVTLLGLRFAGGDDLLKLCDEALTSSVLRAPKRVSQDVF